MANCNKKYSHHINLNLNVRGLSPSATLLINEKSNAMQMEGKKIYKFGLGQSPFPVPDTVVDALKKNAFQKEYLPVKGLPQLQQADA
jgi:aspartate aminotransferase